MHDASPQKMRAAAFSRLPRAPELEALASRHGGSDLHPGGEVAQAVEANRASVENGTALFHASPRDATPPPMARGTPTTPAEQAGWITRIGEASLRALAVAALASVPSALRTARAGGGFLDGLLISAGVLVPLLTLVLLLASSAGRGFRQFVGADSPRSAVLKLALWIGLALPPLALAGTFLKATTHHRGLAGATFAVVALVIAAATLLIAHRLVNFGKALVERGVRPFIPAIIGAAIGLIPLLVVAAPLGRHGGADDTPTLRAAVIDAAIVIVAAALAATTDLGARRPLARILGFPLAALTLILAAARVESSPVRAQAFKQAGGLSAALLGALEHWTDRDADGMGAHFGGHDCDEGDPTRYLGALEIPGDGIDQDCDGIDPPRPLSIAELTPPKSDKSDGPTRLAKATLVAKNEPPALPDIILVTLDTVRADHTSPYGYAQATTPRLAELASRGVLFEHAYATGSDTQRAITPLVTGKPLSESAHSKDEWPTLYPENDTLAERLKRKGYRTAAVTSFTWMNTDHGFSQGFDYFKPIYREAHPERDITGPHAIKAALEVFDELKDDKYPIFLWIHLFDAHDRYLAHPGPRFGKGRGGLYDGEIAFVDKLLGELIQAVDESSRKDRVAWIVHGSHGEAFGEHDFSGHNAEVYDEVIRVPLVIALPSAKAGRYSKAAVTTLDLVPTILELSEAEHENVDGTSLVAIARGDLEVGHAPVRAYARRRQAVIDWPLKLMVHERKRRNRHLLFDLSADPYEKEDISKDHEEDVKRLVDAK